MFDPIPEILFIPACVLLGIIYAIVGAFMLSNPDTKHPEPPEGQ